MIIIIIIIVRDIKKMLFGVWRLSGILYGIHKSRMQTSNKEGFLRGMPRRASIAAFALCFTTRNPTLFRRSLGT
jgi:hypothetical protein